MATGTLSTVGRIVGTAIGGPIGGAIGGAVGAAVGYQVDQALFGPGDQEGPRMDDLSITTSTYGATIPLVYGPNNRVAGNIIWSTDYVEKKHEEGGKGGPTYTSYTYSVSCAVAISGRKIKDITRIWANNTVIYDKSDAPEEAVFIIDDETGLLYPPDLGSFNPLDPGELDEEAAVEIWATNKFGSKRVFNTLRMYNGSDIQLPDSFMEGHEGVGNVPAYRNMAYVVFTTLQLESFGNRIPNFQFEIVADDEISVSGVLDDIATRSDIENTSFFGLEKESLKGYTIANQSTSAAAVLPLAAAYGFETIEQRGQVRHVRKARGPKGSLEVSHTGAYESTVGKTDTKHPIDVTNASDTTLPNRVTVSYKNVDDDYQTDSQSIVRVRGNATSNTTLALPLVLDANEAAEIAERLLWAAWGSKKEMKTALSDRWCRLNPGDIVGVPVAGVMLPMKLVTYSRGHNGVIETTWHYEDYEAFDPSARGIDFRVNRESVTYGGPTDIVLIDAPLLLDSNPDEGFYWAATSTGAGWTGATIHRSIDDGDTYNVVSDVRAISPTGDITGILGNGPSETWDTVNTFTVTLRSPNNTLSSLTDLQVLAGGNAAWVGPAVGGKGEIIHFGNATLVGEGTYEISRLLRGRKGTEHFISTHGADEVMVLLSLGTIGTSTFGVADWNRERLYKPVSDYMLIENTPATSFTNTGERARPLSPVHIRGIRNSGDDLTITWLRRTRMSVPGLGYGVAPLGESTERYKVEIYNGSTLVRTIEADEQSVLYTSAEQTADGLTPGELVKVKIAQQSTTYGWGLDANGLI